MTGGGGQVYPRVVSGGGQCSGDCPTVYPRVVSGGTLYPRVE